MVDRTSQMERLLGYYAGYFATHLIRLGVDGGIFAALAARSNGTDAHQLAQDLGFSERYMEHFLRAGLALQLLDHDRDNGHYSLAPHMEVLLAEPDDYRYMGSMANLYIQGGRDFDRIRALLRTGATHTFQEHDEALIDASASATEGLAQFVARAIVRRLPGLRGRDDLRILDLGCGAGAILVALAKALPHSRLLGVDIEPRSVDKANARIRSAGLQARAEARVAAAEDVTDVGAFDLVTMIQVLHETREDAREAVLGRAYAALRPGGVLLIVDEPYPHELSAMSERPTAVLTQFVEIFMGNVLLSPEEQHHLIDSAGFTVLSQMVPAPGLICVTIARKDPADDQ